MKAGPAVDAHGYRIVTVGADTADEAREKVRDQLDRKDRRGHQPQGHASGDQV
ncbi:MAG: hypothetical protein KKA73_07760 [Chloroflexi bacterium]|nr:hypothetical protein [Chloroflexota bacterium]MBU1747568.1 hypothetical protein [Chloroflexota bacterium]